MLPKLSDIGYKQFKIGDLSGGVNKAEFEANLQDNELSDAKNMWVWTGVLQSRPGLCANTDEALLLKGQKVYINRDITRRVTVENGYETYCLYVTASIASGLNLSLDFVCQSDALKTIHVNSVKLSDVYMLSNCLSWQQGDTLYLLLNTGLPFEVDKFRLFKVSLADDIEFCKEITLDDTYIPTVYTDCKPDIERADELEKATFLEDFNLISNYYSLQYSSVNLNLDFTPMSYFLLKPLAQDGSVRSYAFGKTVTVKITYINGVTAVHTATVTAGDGTYFGSEADFNPVDCLKLKLLGDRIELHNVDGLTALEKSVYVKNNMTITAPCDAKDYSFITGMTKSVRVAGDGKERVFFGGNTVSGCESAVVWSDSEKPLYFPKSNLALLGRDNESVTAFGIVGDSLTVFKQHEIFEISPQGSSGNLSIRQVSTTVGCDCPDTVELCRNRLVWLDSSGRVYSLIHKTTYDERVAVSVSESIEPLIKAHTKQELQSAHSTEWQDKYVLSIANRLYLLYYNTYGFESVSSISKREDKHDIIPWYYWEIPITPQRLLCFDGKLLIPYTLTDSLGENALNLGYFDFNATADTVALFENSKLTSATMPFYSFVSTKAFDCNESYAQKIIADTLIDIESDGRVAFTVTADDVPKMHELDLTVKRKGRLLIKASKRLCRNFKLSLGSSSAFKVYSFNVKYKNLEV